MINILGLFGGGLKQHLCFFVTLCQADFKHSLWVILHVPYPLTYLLLSPPLNNCTF